MASDNRLVPRIVKTGRGNDDLEQNPIESFLQDVSKSSFASPFALAGAGANSIGRAVGGLFNRGLDTSGARERSQPASNPNAIRGRGMKATPFTASQDPQQEQPSIADILGNYLSQAQGLTPGAAGGGVPYQDFSPVRDDVNRTATQNRAYLESIYDQLGRSIDASNQTIEDRYSQTGENLQQITDTAADETQAAYQAAQDERNRQLAALGIEDAQARTIAQGRDAEGQGAQSQADIQSRGQIAQTANTQNQQADQTYNQRIGQAARFAGGEAQQALSDSLASRMAEIAMAESENRASVDAQNAALAQQSAGTQWGQQMNILDLLMGLEQQEYDRSREAAEFAAQNSPQATPNFAQEYLNDLTGYGGLLTGLQQNNPELAQILQDQGVDPYFSYLNQRRRFG